ncbi:putative PurR-regulated permease PerM [Scopulibacillus darangshiensis]|uniref:Putative PurR-regulated permease PerM n=1 Tax=Scopulibacillus darangshiensis TaxID=442528 RepID=A0A4R2PB07_9BACL|nr:AI-2E family transporter [Scopulibacillus darangshiensis]TCP32283.1 putative PurR-regulated permease PerM [Scopulibacillus darangshiensis]
MTKWSAIEWIKRLTILLLIFLNGYLLYKLIPFLGIIFHFLAAILFPFVIAALIAYLFHPIVEKCHKKGIPRSLAIILLYLIFFGVTGYGLFKGAPAVIHQLKSFDKQIPEYTAIYHDHLNDFYQSTPEAVHDHFNGVLKKGEISVNRFVKKIIGAVTWVFQSFFTLIIIPFLAFYFLKDFDGVKKGVSAMTPRKWRHPGRELLHNIDDSLGKYIRGQLYVCLILAVIAFLGLWLLKVPYPMLLSIFIGITDIIPYFGPLIGAIPVIFMAATISLKTVVFVLILIGVLQLLEGNVIGPLVVGKSVDVHPVYIMLSLLIGGEIAGVIGMLFAVPVFVIIRVVIKYFRRQHNKIDKPNDSHL